MNDTTTIRQRLWNSLDMAWVRQQGIAAAVIILIFWAICPTWYPEEPWIALLVLGIVMTPFLIFLACRTYAIFEKAEGYYFCEAKLDAPFGGLFRDSIGFHVTLTDTQGIKHRVDTRAIFHTRSIFGASLEDYVNRAVTVAHNPETGSVVVIG